MKSQKKVFYLIFIFSISLVFLFGGLSFAIEKNMKSPTEMPVEKAPAQKDTSKMMLKKLEPDLIVERIEINNFSTDADSRHVKVTVYIKNQGIASTSSSLTAEGISRGSGGAFKAQVDWSDNPTTGWNRLCESGVTALSAGATSNFFCNDDVPKGTARKFRATVDILNWIDESNETNNVNSAGFVSR
jgi:subtilase family serine protease